MNYKELIEKTAAETMPFKKPDGTWAIPRGYSAPSFNKNDYNERLMDAYGDDYDPLPEGAEMIGDDGYTQGIAATPDGRLLRVDYAAGMHDELNDDNLKELYSTQDHRLMSAARNIDDRALEALGNKSLKKRVKALHGLGVPNEYKHDKKVIGNTTLKGLGVGALSGAVLGVDALSNSRPIRNGLIGVGVGAGLGAIGGALKGVNASRGQYVDKIESGLRQAKHTDKLNSEFLSQYK